jgi:hypothetical protein
MGLNDEIMTKMSTRMNLMSILNVKDESKVQNILDVFFVPLFWAQKGWSEIPDWMRCLSNDGWRSPTKS